MKPKQLVERIMNSVFLACGLTAVAFVLIITVYLLLAGLPALQEIGLAKFLTGTQWKPASSKEPLFGILPLMLSSVYGTLAAALLGVPLGVLMAVFLSKIASPRVRAFTRPAVELLAGIPSVVYGLVGMMVLVPAIAKMFGLAKGSGLLAAILVLTVMILPNIISVSETALNAVPPEYEEASFALGANRMETIFRVSLPAAKSGVAAGITLGIGRAIGEAMAVMMVAGNVANMPSLFESVTFLTTAIAKDMGYAGGLHRQALFSVALVLFVFILIINTVMGALKRRKE